MINTQDIAQWIRSIASIQFSKSSGPGGQNVNNVNTKVTLKLPLTEENIGPLDECSLNRINTKLKTRINNDGELVIQTDVHRHQHQNRELAYQKAEDLILSALKQKKKRVKTKPSAAGRENRLNKKRRRSMIKSTRKAIRPDTE
ncbi:MAG: aminoacyl-tRNA hydrolase [Spirochaetales bacterium]|nr:aminoacyl-tRNA hydrolase [Spirochaetales bacterium]